ncbi:MAG TPA: LamG domain-containing protein [Steroidobacteraceae bacterium]|nr:LamG domain-containing protein [Steroidobacteraceae bacterium]
MTGLELIRTRTRQLAIATALIASAALAACSGGAPTTANPQTAPPTAQGYSGPAPANADVQAFKINLWQNINPTNRCGGCHTAGGQSPQFARSDDVNLAYQAANTVVNLAEPDQSMMVQKVAGGHNCWLGSPQACADTLTVWIRNWAGSSATGGKQIQLQAPQDQTVGSAKTFPASSAQFQTLIWTPILRQYCSRCHSPDAQTPQQPYFASADPDEAYSNAQSKINLDDPSQSRFVIRLGTEFHNCWTDCATAASIMQTAITTFANGITPTQIDPSLVISKALTLYDGTIASGQNRYESAQIALYQFKTGTGNTAYDTSGVEPELDLTLSGSFQWVGGWGVSFGAGGKAQGTTTASKKLFDAITSSGEFSIEAWSNAANVAQTDAYLVSYSGGVATRNMTLGQHAFQYEAFARSSVTNTNGAPSMLTDPTKMLAQAALQHVVLTYDPVNGRKLYVNGVPTGDVDAKGGGTLANWDDTFALVLGNETSGNRQWMGALRMVAIHNRALTLPQIQQNFAAGVGEKYFLLFNVSQLTNVPQSYIMFEGALNDSYSYLFDKPTFISLDPTQTPDNIVIKGMRIGINGAEAQVGQSYIPLNTTITAANYNSTTGQLLSTVGAVIALQKGPSSDQFFLTFEQIGSNTHAYTDPVVAVTPPTPGTQGPDLGIRTFERINQSMAKVTGVSAVTSSVNTTYQSVQQALPAVADITAYSAANQTAISQLAISYCSALVDNSSLRSQFFGSFDPTQNGNYIANPTVRDPLVQAIYNNLVGQGPGATAIGSQPTFTAVQNELDSLIANLTAGANATQAGRAGVVAKASCAAVLGSASTILQ